ncbi:hypothetical protein NKH45_30720 [Mesorhizobium sp. M1156]|uniref:hypothetical protein n=1 Tax=Mesorhizobium sp. M1156 TaxID=2957064 RepID=UPI0033355833
MIDDASPGGREWDFGGQNRGDDDDTGFGSAGPVDIGDRQGERDPRKRVRKYTERGLETPAQGQRKPHQAAIDPFTAMVAHTSRDVPDAPAAGFSGTEDLGYGGGYYPKANAKEPCGPVEE